MPQSQTTTKSQSNGSSNGDQYTAIDPQRDPIAFVYQNRQALADMPEDKALRFVDRLFQRYALPKYQRVNRNIPLDEDEIENLRLQFTARMFNVPFERTELKGPKVEHGLLEKGAQAASAAGAGVIGGLRTIEQLREKIQKNLGPIGKLAEYDPVNIGLKKLVTPAGKVEERAFSEAKEVLPRGADIAAGVGHQIPASLAAGAVGGAIPNLGAGAGPGMRVLEGATRGAAEGRVFESARPGGDPEAGGRWGAALGAAFPALGGLFGLGKRVTKAATTAAEVGKTGAPAAAEAAPKTLGDIAETVAKKKFGKAFKDLTSAERAQMPEAMKSEIKAQQAVKSAKAQATKAASKAATEAEKTAERTAKAQAATAEAQAQAAKRAAGTEVKVTPESAQPQTKVPSSGQYTAAKATEENPEIAKTMAGFKPGEGTAAAAPGQTIKTNTAQEIESAKYELNKAKNILKNPNATAEEKKIAKDNYVFWKEKLGEDPVFKKIPEGETGPKVRAKGGQPASPAQQKADAERQAAKRAEAKSQEFGAALESKAREIAGRYTTASQVGVQQIPELEEAVKDLEGGNVVLGGLQKLRRAKKITDEIYADSLKEWLLNQFASKSD